MNILVTGHKGFIGSHLINYLLSKGHTVDGWEWQSNAMPKVETYDWCVHTGAISSTTFSDVDQILEQNLEFSIRLARLCEKVGTNLQYSSSASVYGPATHFIEDGALLPQSPYAWSKYLFDRFINQHLHEFKITIQGFRYFNVYGAGESHKGNQASPFTKFIQQATENRVIKLFENSDQYKRDFVYVEDLCKLHRKMFYVESSGIFNAGTGTAVSFDSIGRAIAKKYGALIKYIPMPAELRGQYQEYTCANLTKLNSVVDQAWISILDHINDTPH